MNILQRAKSSTVAQCFQIFSKSDQRKLSLVIFLQILLSGLDLIGVALIGVIGALAVTGIQSAEPGDRVGALLKILN